GRGRLRRTQRRGQEVADDDQRYEGFDYGSVQHPSASCRFDCRYSLRDPIDGARLYFRTNQSYRREQPGRRYENGSSPTVREGVVIKPPPSLTVGLLPQPFPFSQFYRSLRPDFFRHQPRMNLDLQPSSFHRRIGFGPSLRLFG